MWSFFLSTELLEQDCASILGHWSVLKGSVRNRPGRAAQAKCQYYLLLEQGIYSLFPFQRRVSQKSRFMLFLCFEDSILYLRRCCLSEPMVAIEWQNLTFSPQSRVACVVRVGHSIFITFAIFTSALLYSQNCSWILFSDFLKAFGTVFVHPIYLVLPPSHLLAWSHAFL